MILIASDCDISSGYSPLFSRNSRRNKKKRKVFQATRDAGRMAGFNVLQIVNEPTAAAIAFCEQNDEPIL